VTQPPHSTDKPLVHALHADDYWLGQDHALPVDRLHDLVCELREIAPRAIREGFARMKQAARHVERGTSQQAAAILGVKSRKLQAMSARGEIPGAAKLGRQWTYDLPKLRQFIDQQEKITCQGSAKRPPDAIGAAISSGRKLEGVGAFSAGRLRQMIQQSQKRVTKRAKRER
jgi:hypothetical protein